MAGGHGVTEPTDRRDYGAAAIFSRHYGRRAGGAATGPSRIACFWRAVAVRSLRCRRAPAEGAARVAIACHRLARATAARR